VWVPISVVVTLLVHRLTLRADERRRSTED
jgi:hypothetical protein